MRRRLTTHRPSEVIRRVLVKAEVWWKMREWFMGGEADIEDDGALIGQVSSRGYSIQSDRRIKLQPKDEMGKSLDEADGLAMTFAPTSGRANLRWIE